MPQDDDEAASGAPVIHDHPGLYREDAQRASTEAATRVLRPPLRVVPTVAVDASPDRPEDPTIVDYRVPYFGRRTDDSYGPDDSLEDDVIFRLNARVRGLSREAADRIIGQAFFTAGRKMEAENRAGDSPEGPFGRGDAVRPEIREVEREIERRASVRVIQGLRDFVRNSPFLTGLAIGFISAYVATRVANEVATEDRAEIHLVQPAVAVTLEPIVEPIRE